MKRFITSLLSTAMLLSATTMPAFAEEDTVIEEETIEIGEPAEDPECHWEFVGDVAYWIEHGKRQGVYGDPLNVWDTQYDKVERGREIYDPESDDWYWLDACYDGAAAVSKECWFPYVFQGEAPGSTDGKWVRYDHHGGMIKYFALRREPVFNEYGNCVSHRTLLYYYHNITGAMLKGNIKFEDRYGANPDAEEGEEDGIVHIELPFDRLDGTLQVTNEVIDELRKLHAEEWAIYDIDMKKYGTLQDLIDWHDTPKIRDTGSSEGDAL